jgi:predicted DNA-binding transcriptional regulator YafY
MRRIRIGCGWWPPDGKGRPAGLDRLFAVARAIAAGRRLRILYEDGAGSRTGRVVSPLGLAHRAGHWLLAAHCHLRRAFRLFRVDRMRSIRLARGRIGNRLAPPGFDPRFLSAEAYCVSGHGLPALATVRLLPPLDRVAGALFPAALLEQSSPGVLCHLRVTEREALIRLVASFGDSAALTAWRPAADPFSTPAGPVH